MFSLRVTAKDTIWSSMCLWRSFSATRSEIALTIILFTVIVVIAAINLQGWGWGSAVILVCFFSLSWLDRVSRLILLICKGLADHHPRMEANEITFEGDSISFHHAGTKVTHSLKEAVLLELRNGVWVFLWKSENTPPLLLTLRDDKMDEQIKAGLAGWSKPDQNIIMALSGKMPPSMPAKDRPPPLPGKLR